MKKSPVIPEKKPINKPTNGKAQAALLKSGALFEKYDQLTGIRVKNISVATKSITYLFFIKNCIITFFC